MSPSAGCVSKSRVGAKSYCKLPIVNLERRGRSARMAGRLSANLETLSQKLLDVCCSSTRASKEKQLCATRVDGDVVTSPSQYDNFSSATDQETEETSMPFRSKTL